MAISGNKLYEQPTRILNSSLSGWVETDKPVIITGAFENSSTNNHWYRDHEPNESYDRGSNWTAVSSSFSNDPVYVNVQCRFGTWFGYQGPVLVHEDNHFDENDFVSLYQGFATSDLDLYGLGATAISKCIPTNPISDVPTAVAELLSEGLPGIPGGQFLRGGSSIPSRLGAEYLNHQFGILPLLSEMREFAKAYSRAEELINEYAARAGRKIRKRYDFPVSESTLSVDQGTPITQSGQWFGGIGQQYIRDFLTPAYGGTPGTRVDTTTKTKKSWFSGCFTFYLPGVGKTFSDKLFREEALMRHLYGGISGNTAWELLPYSWAVDWLTNAGDVIHNVNAFARDGLVMPWGYIMESCKLHVDRRVEGAAFGRMDSPPDAFYFPDVVTTSFDVKYLRRRKATPFGFGLDVDGFTGRQQSIIAALGLVKAL
jgi:hypothetical protein